MGGPDASVILREGLSAPQLMELDQWIRSLGDGSLREVGDGEWSASLLVRHYELLDLADVPTTSSCTFWIEYKTERDQAWFDSQPYIAARPQDRIPIYVGYDEDLRLSVAEIESQLRQALGFDVKWRITVSAGCRGYINHQILGHLVLEIARRYNGFIDMHGEIMPLGFRSPGRSSVPQRGSLDEEEHRERLRAYLRQFPGKVFELHVGAWIPNDTPSMQHVVDVDFFRAWIAHPDFLMSS